MRIAIGCDHRGLEVKREAARLLAQHGQDVLDLGADGEQSVDYPDIAAAVAGAVSQGQAERGVLICGTGIGMAIAANKFAGVRAAAVGDAALAEICRRHNDCNVLCLPESLRGEALRGTVEAWLLTAFEGGRHQRRVDKIAELERRRGPC